VIKKILTYSFGEVLVKGLSFLAIPLYSSMILPEEYGALGFLNALIVFLPFIFTLYYLYAYVRFSIDVADDSLISTYIFMGLFLNIFYLLFALLLYFLVIENFEILLKYYLLAILSSAVMYIFQIMQFYHRSKGFAKKYLQYSIVYALSGLGLNFLLLYSFSDNVLAMLNSKLILSMIVSLSAYRVLKKYISWKKFDKNLMYDILKYSVPLVPGAIALLLFSSSDKLILVKYISKEELGIYTLAATMGLGMGYIGRAFFMGYQPLFYEKIADNKYAEIQEQFSKNVLMLLVAMIAILVVVYVGYKLIDDKYVEGMPIAISIALTYTLVTFSQLMELHLSYMKKSSYISYIYGFGGVVTVFTLLQVIPDFGTRGAVVVLFFTALMTSFLMYYMAQKVLYVRYNRLYLLLFYSTVVSLWYLFLIH